MKKLPIGKQSFIVIRKNKEKVLYVDKTRDIYNLVKSEAQVPYFLSRPRRFGKSLLLDTMRCLFEGRKELFEGLYIYSRWDWNEVYPVIRIVFGDGFMDSVKTLQSTFKSILLSNCEDNGINYDELRNDTYNLKFKELIVKLYEKTGKQVVVLVDEYDKPILDKINDLETAKELRDELKGFYSVLKGADEYLKFVFLTGVSKFSKVSLFSGLNNLKDLTLNKETGEICGFTEEEITTNFDGYLDDVDRDKMKIWYNGFNFMGKNKVYNPFDVLLFLDSKEYKNYWFETATPTFLIELLKSYKGFYHIPKLENLELGEEIMGSFDIEKIKIETLLFQTGYLTIKEHCNLQGENNYKLQIPNQEIRNSLNKYIISDYLQAFDMVDYFYRAKPIYEALTTGNVENLIKYLKVVYANIAYSNVEHIAKYEGYYVSVFYAFLFSMGMEVIQEDITNEGRIDITIKIENYIYVIEFKVEKTGLQALEQIKDRKYVEKYMLEDKEIWMVGINFSFDDRNIESYESEKVK